MTLQELGALVAMVNENDPRHIDMAEGADLMFRHLFYSGMAQECDREYLTRFFIRSLRSAVYEDRETRMIYEALKP
jgi:hypothetical protein